MHGLKWPVYSTRIVYISPTEHLHFDVGDARDGDDDVDLVMRPAATRLSVLAGITPADFCSNNILVSGVF